MNTLLSTHSKITLILMITFQIQARGADGSPKSLDQNLRDIFPTLNRALFPCVQSIVDAENHSINEAEIPKSTAVIKNDHLLFFASNKYGGFNERFSANSILFPTGNTTSADLRSPEKGNDLRSNNYIAIDEKGIYEGKANLLVNFFKPAPLKNDDTGLHAVKSIISSLAQLLHPRSNDTGRPTLSALNEFSRSACGPVTTIIDGLVDSQKGRTGLTPGERDDLSSFETLRGSLDYLTSSRFDPYGPFRLFDPNERGDPREDSKSPAVQ